MSDTVINYVQNYFMARANLNTKYADMMGMHKKPVEFPGLRSRRLLHKGCLGGGTPHPWETFIMLDIRQ